MINKLSRLSEEAHKESKELACGDTVDEVLIDFAYRAKHLEPLVHKLGKAVNTFKAAFETEEAKDSRNEVEEIIPSVGGNSVDPIVNCFTEVFA